MGVTRAPRRALAGDAALYLAFTVFAGVSALASTVSGYRLWGSIAVIGYLAGLVQSVVLSWPSQPRSARMAGPLGRLVRSRATPMIPVALCGIILPLIILIHRRTGGLPWSQQPEVWVIERAARLLLRHGSPYLNPRDLGRPPMVSDYTPYGPPMAVFGLPRALLGASALTDARIAFVLMSVITVALAWLVLGRPRIPVRSAQLALACPLTALTLSVAGDDVPVVALLLLALALQHRRASGLCGAVLATAVSMKLIAVPALVVLAVTVFADRGGRALARFAVSALCVGAVLTVPIMLVDPTSFVEQVIRFPLGLGLVTSPAASPLPGHLIARLGTGGHAIALVLLAGAALATVGWLISHPPRTAADAAMRIAVGTFAAIMVAPSTRFGYLLYPTVLLAASLALRTLTPASGPEPLVTTRRAADRLLSAIPAD